MKTLVHFLLLFPILTNAQLMTPINGDIVYTTSEGRIIEELTGKAPETVENKSKFETYKDLFLNKKKTYVPNLERKKKFNDYFQVKRDDRQVVTVKMSPNDVVDISMCYQAPVRISLGRSINEEILDVVADDVAFLSAIILKDAKSSLVKMKLPIKDDGVWRSGVRIISAKTYTSYNFNIVLEKCPDGELKYPKEIIIERMSTIANISDRVLVSEDLITEASQGYPRENSENIVDVYDGIISPNAEYAVLGVAIKIGNPQKTKMKTEFVFLDALQSKIMESRAEYLKISSQKVTNDTGHPTLRFNIILKADGFGSMKRYAVERNFVYMLIVDHTDGYYQYVQIPLRELFERKKLESWELN